MDALVTHVNNGVRSEVDHALDVVLELLGHYCKIILRFTPLIKVWPSNANQSCDLEIMARADCVGPPRASQYSSDTQGLPDS